MITSYYVTIVTSWCLVEIFVGYTVSVSQKFYEDETSHFLEILKLDTKAYYKIISIQLRG